MKLLLVQNMIYIPTLGGANKSNRLLIEGLAGRGHQCSVVATAFGSHGPSDRRELLELLAELLRGHQ